MAGTRSQLSSDTGQALLTTAQLAELTAGGRCYIRTKKGVPVALAYNLKLNPDAPKKSGEPGVIVVGDGDRIVQYAKQFLDLGIAIPAYLKIRTDAWQPVGDYRATDFRQDDATIKQHSGGRDPSDLAGILFIEPASELTVSGGSFADLLTRKKVEMAAIKVATQYLEKKGYDVSNYEKQNRGYDLLATSGTGSLLVEVKGTDARQPHFYVTRNERRSSEKQTNWRLFVVCEARTASPVLFLYTTAEMNACFNLDPLAWEAALRPE